MTMPPHATPQVGSSAPIHHVVAFKFRPDVTSAQISLVLTEFRKLKELSVDPTTGRKLIQSLHGGTNNSPEGLNKGFSCCFVLTFSSPGDRDTYVGLDPTQPFDLAHDRFKKLVGPLLDGGAEGVLVIDFEDGQTME